MRYGETGGNVRQTISGKLRIPQNRSVSWYSMYFYSMTVSALDVENLQGNSPQDVKFSVLKLVRGWKSETWPNNISRNIPPLTNDEVLGASLASSLSP
jgi:hypothetical protein